MYAFTGIWYGEAAARKSAKQIADKIEAKNQAQAERQAAQKEKKAAGKKGGNAQKNKGNSTDYLGSKK